MTRASLSLFAALGVLAGVVAFGCSSNEASEQGAGGEEEDEGALTSPDPNTAPKAAGALTFKDACAGTSSITLGAFGDVLMHTPLQKQAYASPEGFKSTWKGAMGLLGKADLTYANLEGPTAPGFKKGGSRGTDPGKVYDDVVYSSYPTFNYHPSLIDDLKASGVDVVSTANNHAMDRATGGADETIAQLEQRGMPHTGSKRAASQEAWHTTTEAKGFKVAWLACAFSTNGIPDPKAQVLRCFDGEQGNGAKPNPEMLRVIGQLSSDPSIDAVIVTPHWGIEYEYKPRDFQVSVGRAFLDAGATAVFGGHPHVIQPWDKVVTKDGREGFILYSFGNFAAGQISSNGTPLLAQRTSLAMYVGLSKAPGKKAWVNGVKYVPLFMETDGSIYARPTSKDEKPGSLAARSYDLATRVFGEWNQVGANDAVVTNPECHR